MRRLLHTLIAVTGLLVPQFSHVAGDGLAIVGNRYVYAESRVMGDMQRVELIRIGDTPFKQDDLVRGIKFDQTARPFFIADNDLLGEHASSLYGGHLICHLADEGFGYFVFLSRVFPRMKLPSIDPHSNLKCWGNTEVLNSRRPVIVNRSSFFIRFADSINDDLGRILWADPRSLGHLEVGVSIVPLNERDYSVEEGCSESEPCRPPYRILYGIASVIAVAFVSFRYIVRGKSFFQSFFLNLLLILSVFGNGIYGGALILESLRNFR